MKCNEWKCTLLHWVSRLEINQDSSSSFLTRSALRMVYTPGLEIEPLYPWKSSRCGGQQNNLPWTTEHRKHFWRVVTMVSNTRNFSVSGLYPSSGVWRKTTFRKLDLFPPSGKRGGAGVQWLRLALSKGPNWVGVFFPPLLPEDGNRPSFRNVVFLQTPDDE
jgi:hypothetical protein